MRHSRSRLGYGNNRSCTTYTVDGITDTLQGWAKRLGTTYICLYKRIAIRGMSPEDAIRTGSCNMNRTYVVANGETHTIAEWSRKTGVDGDLISERMSRGGWSPEEAVGLVPHASKAECRIKWNGIERNIVEWAKKLGVEEGVLRGRIHEWRAGRMLKKDVFRSTLGGKGRQRRSYKKCYRGKKYTIKELCAMKGVVPSWFHSKLKEGHSVHDIMTTVEPCRDRAEIATRSAASFRRNRRLRELRKMGVIV